MKFSGPFEYVPPTKTASDYNESEKAEFVKIFRPRARDYRCLKALFFGLCIAFFIATIIFKIDDVFELWFTLMAIYVVLYYTLFKPLCPACNKNTDTRVRTFCPECGSGKISPGGFMRSIECLSCGEVLRQGKGGRRYNVRYCTHCGVFLDSKGI